MRPFSIPHFRQLHDVFGNRKLGCSRAIEKKRREVEEGRGDGEEVGWEEEEVE